MRLALPGVGSAGGGTKLKQVYFLYFLKKKKALDSTQLDSCYLPTNSKFLSSPTLLPSPPQRMVLSFEVRIIALNERAFLSICLLMVETVYTVAFGAYAFKLKSTALRVQKHWLLKIKCIFSALSSFTMLKYTSCKSYHFNHF